EDNHRLLEIGHGNGSHIEWMLKLADGLHYQGVDISGTMIAEASRLNEPFVNANRVSFVLSDGKSLPFDKNQFDRIFTVNTVYFWEEPDSYLKEIIRTLKPAGVFSLGYGTKNSMNKLPFTQFGFTLYNPEEIEEMIRKAGFNLIGSVHHTEEIVSKSGDRMTRDFSVTTARKPLEI
ncbi:MAG TPA: class I SAM-dependent methyltransferase, partial [Parasegetibacter sp.]